MESTTSRDRTVAIVLTWLITVIALAWAAWALARLGGHPAVIGAAGQTPPPGGGLPWG
jgi:hypothetical protein